MNRNLKAHFKNFVVFFFWAHEQTVFCTIRAQLNKHQNVAVKERRLSKLYCHSFLELIPYYVMRLI